jgi:serine/threonine protein kinase
VVTARRIDHIPIQPDPEAGRVLDGRYVIRGLLGRGAMARVFLAEDSESGEPVAVKVLESLVGARSDTAKQRFFREARAAAMLKHPSIVRILDLGLRDDGVPYLVLEHLFGEVLGELLRRVSVLGAGLGLAIVREAAAGLVVAHAAGIVHRDVKPDNVFLVGAPGEPYGVKLLDFGLAKLDQQSGFTKAGTAVGTMEYMAPEQLLTERPDARTDVYALGVVMYRMFTGRLPFEGKDEAELLARQLIDPGASALHHRSAARAAHRSGDPAGPVQAPGQPLPHRRGAAGGRGASARQTPGTPVRGEPPPAPRRVRAPLAVRAPRGEVFLSAPRSPRARVGHGAARGLGPSSMLYT